MLTGYTDGHTRLTETTIPALWHLLDNPPADLIAVCRYASERHFLDETRLLRDALGKLVGGTLQGLFDDHTTIALDWTAPIQSLSLSRLEGLGDEAVGMALLCLNSWGRAMREVAAPGDLRIVVRDEVVEDHAARPGRGEELRRRPAAVAAATATSSSRSPTNPPTWTASATPAPKPPQIAKDLLHLADTKILHGQDAAVADQLADPARPARHRQSTGSPTGAAKPPAGPCGWSASGVFKVETILHPGERHTSPGPTAASEKAR